MQPRKLTENEEGTVGLPIRIVVLSIVGFIGFYAIISAISSAPSPPEPLYAQANVSAVFLPSGEENNTETNLTLLVTALDGESQRVGGANVILRSPDRNRAYSGVTDAEGKVVIELKNPELPPGKSEGYISLKAMKTGYQDYVNDYFVKVTRS
ncbi:MAG: carboxypeptidase-like regulatory domain-containing protein [Methanosarcinaceae archaeon]